MENGLFVDIAKDDFPRFVTYEDENDKLNLRGVFCRLELVGGAGFLDG